jgi:hypothetical protein
VPFIEEMSIKMVLKIILIVLISKWSILLSSLIFSLHYPKEKKVYRPYEGKSQKDTILKEKIAQA